MSNQFTVFCVLLILSCVFNLTFAQGGNPPQNIPPIGVADKPAQRNDDPTWVAKHQELIEKARHGNIRLYFVGDSITRRWEATHNANWRQNFSGWDAADFGAGGDRIQNVLYRLENGELDGVNPQVVVMLVGTNNVGFTPVVGSDAALVKDVANGIATCLGIIRRKAPAAKILLIGITPRNTDGSTALMPTINKINRRIARLANGKTVKFLNINARLADKNGKLFDGMTDDRLHLTDQGYQIWADAMQPILTKWLGARKPE